MPGIYCNVKSCKHNRTGSCCIEHGNVGGYNAISTGDTNCNSYEKRTLGAKEMPCRYSMINCSAENCIHNYKGDCAAENIKVSGVNAHAQGETECGSFSVIHY